jgi:hypothetical protein
MPDSLSGKVLTPRQLAVVDEHLPGPPHIPRIRYPRGHGSLGDLLKFGPPKPRRLDQPIAVSRKALVSGDHFYRHLEAKLDLSFVREWVRERYAERGWLSIDAVLFFKLAQSW